MLCKECKNRTFKTLEEAKKCGRDLEINNRGHQVEIDGEQMWRPGFNEIELQSWCDKKCEGRRVKNLLAKPAEEKVITPTIAKDKLVQSSNKNMTDKKKD